jgi:hypothetical protein
VKQEKAMYASIEEMSGEELLLLTVLGGRNVAATVERELDRRALLGPPTPTRAKKRMSRPIAAADYRRQVA